LNNDMIIINNSEGIEINDEVNEEEEKLNNLGIFTLYYLFLFNFTICIGLIMDMPFYFYLAIIALSPIYNILIRISNDLYQYLNNFITKNDGKWWKVVILLIKDVYAKTKKNIYSSNFPPVSILIIILFNFFLSCGLSLMCNFRISKCESKEGLMQNNIFMIDEGYQYLIIFIFGLLSNISFSKKDSIDLFGSVVNALVLVPFIRFSVFLGYDFHFNDFGEFVGSLFTQFLIVYGKFVLFIVSFAFFLAISETKKYILKNLKLIDLSKIKDIESKTLFSINDEEDLELFNLEKF
jgi:hypothetical protein